MGSVSHDLFLDVPIQRHIDFPVAGFKEGAGIHSVPTHVGIDLEFYANVVTSDVLYVNFHGAINLGTEINSRFVRVATNVAAGNAFVSFADPTLSVAPGLSLTWYLGTPGWDPQVDMLRVVARITEQVGAGYVVFIGEHGGGFAALRCSAQLPGSLAFVYSPETAVLAADGEQVQQYLDAALMGVSKDEVPADQLSKFDLKIDSAFRDPVNHVYYRQNLNDPSRIAAQYNPFRRACGLSASQGTDHTGRRLFVLTDSECLGKGPSENQEFQDHLDRALDFAFPDRSSVTNHDTVGREESTAVGGGEAGDYDLESLRTQLTTGLESISAQYRSLSRLITAVPGDAEALSRFSKLLFSPEAVLPRLGSFALRAETLLWIVHRILEDKPKTIVECGSGASTVWMAAVCKFLGHGHVYSLEHDPFYAEETNALIKRNGLAEYSSVLIAPLETDAESDRPWYSNEATIKLPENIDLLLVDGPPAAVGPLARMPVIKHLTGHVSGGSVIVVDDANRADERRLVGELLKCSSDKLIFSRIAKLADAVVVACTYVPQQGGE